MDLSPSFSSYRPFLKKIEEKCGLFLREEKTLLLENRLASLMEREKVTSPLQLFEKTHDFPHLMTEIMDQLLIHETSFFRDPPLFEFLETSFFPAHLSLTREMRIWCAGGATGQEAFSLAMMILRNKEKGRGPKITILSTDISATSLERAQKGIYSPFEVGRGLSPLTLSSFFLPHPEGWQIKEEVRSLVTFQQHNLLEPFSSSEGFDLILCRNVLIYFKESRRLPLLKMFSYLLKEEGMLILGASEALLPEGSCFLPVRGISGVYKVQR